MVNIVFFGTPNFGVPALNRLVSTGTNISAVVTQPDRPKGRGHRVGFSPVKRFALANDIPVLQPSSAKEPNFIAQLATYSPDLGVVVAYGQFLLDSVLNAPRLGTINVHASLLPKYRGAAPIHRAVIAGERETGITVIRLVKEMDAGPMLSRAVRPIGTDESSEEIENDLADIGAELLVSVVANMSSGRCAEVLQDDSLATMAPRLTRQDGCIDWTRSAVAVHNLVRGLHPWPHAFTYLHGERHVILRTFVDIHNSMSQHQPGTICVAHGDQLLVACGSQTTIGIKELQTAGRSPLPTRAFLSGRPIAPLSVFRAHPESS